MTSSVFKVNWRVATYNRHKPDQFNLNKEELIFSTKENAERFERNLIEAADFLGKITLETQIKEIELDSPNE
jgi:hypothetical protein